MSHAVAVESPSFDAVRISFLWRLFQAFLALALLTGAIALGGRMLGHALSMAGHTESNTLREIVVGNDLLRVPDNMIRQERARRDGVVAKLDLYMRWPTLSGYSTDAKADFNNAGGKRDILFLTLEPKVMTLDMSGRLEPVYRSVIENAGEPVTAGMTTYKFRKDSGYRAEELVVGPTMGSDRFVARCLTAEAAEDSLAPCERDVSITDTLSLTYRFPKELLADWRNLDERVTQAVNTLVQRAE